MSDTFLSKTAEELDAADELRSFRSEFRLPIFEAVGADLVEVSKAKEPCTYLCGNSLGALAKRSEELVQEELSVWATRAVQGHFDHPHDRPWLPIAGELCPALAKLIGAEPSEVACMSTLTANLHLMMTSFYKPTREKFKIICEAKAFPSDRYAFHSQVRLHGFEPSDAVIEVSPRAGEYTLREEDILSVIKQHGPSIALVLFPGVQFYTGQWFPIESITKAGHAEDAIVGWDLAHAIGNVYPLKLHDWEVDFAVWCSYKYLNSGPGGIGGLFVHSNWDEDSPRLHGWWGHDHATRFLMPHKFSRMPGAAGYQQSNPGALLAVSLMGSLELFQRAPNGIAGVRRKSEQLTAWLENKLRASKYFVGMDSLPLTPNEVSERKMNGKIDARFTIITPSDPVARGAQLSLLWPAGEGIMQRVFIGLKRRGVIGDEREPDVIRLSPAPLYNSFGDCARAADILEEVLDQVSSLAAAADVG